jgi:hypothetical protein
MSVLDSLAEQKIAEAVSRGELDDLPGAGQPLDLDEDPLVPEELRLAYRILRNAGFVPAEVQSLKDEAARPDILTKLELLRAAASARRQSAAFRTRRRLS